MTCSSARSRLRGDGNAIVSSSLIRESNSEPHVANLSSELPPKIRRLTLQDADRQFATLTSPSARRVQKVTKALNERLPAVSRKRGCNS